MPMDGEAGEGSDSTDGGGSDETEDDSNNADGEAGEQV